MEKPEVFAVSNLPPKVGKIIEDKNPYFFSKNKIAWTGNEESMKNFLENVNLQDQFSNRFFKDHLPELYQLLQGKMY